MAKKGIDIGKAYVQIVPSAEGIKNSVENILNDQAGDAGMKAGQSIGSSLCKSLGKFIIAAGIGNLLKTAIVDSFDLGSELQQNLGGTEAVFGDFAGEIQESAKSAYQDMGLSASSYMATANKMASLFQGSGIDQEKSLDLTTQAMQRAADVASVMGIDTEWAMESISAAAKGNFEMMDNLGVAMNATTLQAYALEKGINFKWNTATNAEKAELAMKMFMDRTSQYAGNFARESQETLSGSFGMLKASYQDLMANLLLGQDVTASAQNVANSIVAVAQNAAPALINVVVQLIPALISVLQTLLPQIMTYAGELLNTLWMGIQANLPTILQSGIDIILSLINGLIAAIPNLIASIPTIIGGIVDTFLSYDWLQIGFDIISGIGQGIIDSVGSLIDDALAACGEFVDNIKSFFGISSPSKLFTWIGEMDMAGLSKGIKDNVGAVNAEMKKAMATIKDTTFNERMGLDGYSSSNGQNSPSPRGFNQTVNIYSTKQLNPSEVARQARNATRQMILNLSIGR